MVGTGLRWVINGTTADSCTCCVVEEHGILPKTFIVGVLRDVDFHNT